MESKQFFIKWLEIPSLSRDVLLSRPSRVVSISYTRIVIEDKTTRKRLSNHRKH